MRENDAFDRIQHFVADINSGTSDSIRTFVAADFFNYSPRPDEPTASDVFQDTLSDIMEAFSDFRMSVQDLRDESGLIRAQVTMEGTHDGNLWGAPPTHKFVSWSFQVALRSIGGRFGINIENIAPPQITAMMRQIHLVPPADQMDQPPRYPVSLPEILLKVIFTGQVADKPCSHLDRIKVTQPGQAICQDCAILGDVWPALRMCLVCGYVGCCDTSKNKHMKQHHGTTGHPLFRSIRLDEGWVWCYEDSAFFSKRILENR